MSQIDSRKISAGRRVQTDVCIVGAWAAGITIARELAKTKLSVCLLEAGGMAADPDTEDLNRGVVSGYYSKKTRYLWRSRLRYFGGSTNHWDGACAPFEPWDFEGSEQLGNPGWPVYRATLDPFYDRAAPVVGITPFDYEIGKKTRRVYDFHPSSGLINRLFHFSGDLRFKTRFGTELFE